MSVLDWAFALLISGALQSCLLAVLAFVGKGFFQHSLNKELLVAKAAQDQDLAAFNARSGEQLAQFKTALDRGLDSHRHDLHVLAAEHEARFSRRHELQVEVLRNLFKLVVDAEIALKFLLLSLQSARPANVDEQQAKAVKAVSELRLMYRHNEILFTGKTCGIVKDVLERHGELVLQLKMAQASGTGESMDVAGWLETWMAVNEQLPVVRTALVEEYRGLLGVVADAGPSAGSKAASSVTS